MFFAYILKSHQTGSYYYGHCEDLGARFKSHNACKVRSTKSERPWNIHYYEEFQTKSEAYKREIYFKSRNGYKYLKRKEII